MDTNRPTGFQEVKKAVVNIDGKSLTLIYGTVTNPGGPRAFRRGIRPTYIDRWFILEGDIGKAIPNQGPISSIYCRLQYRNEWDKDNIEIALGTETGENERVKFIHSKSYVQPKGGSRREHDMYFLERGAQKEVIDVNDIDPFLELLTKMKERALEMIEVKRETVETGKKVVASR